MNKQNLLDQETKAIESCKICKRGMSGKAVAGEGNPNAKLVFIGEAPGLQEAKEGRPFIGRSGKFLTKLLDSIGIDRKNVFITSPVKYYPGRRAPNDVEIAHGKTHLDRQITIINPKVIVALGRVAAKAILSEDISVSKLHGRTVKKNNYPVYITYHPSAAMRFTKVRNLTLTDFQNLKKLLIR